MAKTPSTVKNICNLIILRFIGTEFNTRDVAKFLDVTERRARDYINAMLENELIEEVGKRSFRVVGLTKEVFEVITHLQNYLKEVELVIQGEE